MIQDAIKSAILSIRLQSGRAPGVEAPSPYRINKENVNTSVQTEPIANSPANEVRLKKHVAEEKYNPAVAY